MLRKLIVCIALCLGLSGCEDDIKHFRAGLLDLQVALQKGATAWTFCDKKLCIAIHLVERINSDYVRITRSENPGRGFGYTFTLVMSAKKVSSWSEMMLRSDGCLGPVIACEMKPQTEWIDIYKALIPIYNNVMTIK